MSLSDLAQLFFGIAAVLGALFSGVSGLVIAIRSTRKVAKDAARGVLDRALHQDDDEDDDEERDDADAALLERLRELDERRRGDRS